MSTWEPDLSRNTRFHLRLGERRTTATLDTQRSTHYANWLLDGTPPPPPRLDPS